MSGFLERLVQRGRGGAALGDLALLRPIDPIYAGTQAPEAEPDALVVGDVRTSPAAQEPAQSGRSSSEAARMPAGRPAPRTGPKPASPTGAAQASAKPVPSPRQPRTPEEAIAALLRKIGDESASPAGRNTSQPTPEPPARPQPEPGPAPKPEPRVVPSQPAPTPMARSEVLPARPRALRADVEPRARPNAPAAPLPLVSIGRIEIEVAPPPRAPEARPAPARSRGFAAYDRVRRGLDR